MAAFLVLNIAGIALIVAPKFFGKSDEAPVAASPLDNVAIIDLGRLEITKPIDPMQQTFMRCSATITLTVPADRAAEIEPRIRKFESIFKEQARKAFLDADPRDIATENLAGVKNAIKTRINEMLGEEAVLDVVCRRLQALLTNLNEVPDAR